MLNTLLRKRLSEEQMANVFINGLIEVIDSSFPILAEMINDDTAFVSSPNISPENNGPFSMIVFAANLNLLESSFEPEHAGEIEKLVLQKLAVLHQESLSDFKVKMKETQAFINKVNYPSKNLVYGMSKSIFSKYGLHEFQDAYFKSLMAPNPLFLKRMDEVTKLFIWDWDAFFKKFKL